MKRIRRTSAWATLLSLLALLLGAAAANGAEGTNLDPALCAPDQNSFTLGIDNNYFPLPLGRQWVLLGKEQGQEIGLRVTVLNATETFYRGRKSVTTRVVEEAEWEDANGNTLIDPGENLREISVNHFAQTQSGTVCYFGEQVDIYEAGVVVSHAGSWRADARGNAPGIFMPAQPQLGMTYQQEFAPGVAEDQATIVSVGKTVTVPAGTFENTIKVRDFNPLDGSRGTKAYAPSVGIIIDGPLALVRY